MKKMLHGLPENPSDAACSWRANKPDNTLADRRSWSRFPNAADNDKRSFVNVSSVRPRYPIEAEADESGFFAPWNLKKVGWLNVVSESLTAVH
ncbi:hypothetical protein ACU5AY_17920 [Rhizobium sp. PAMB 3174]